MTKHTTSTVPRKGSPFVAGRPLRPGEPIFGREAAFHSVADQRVKYSSVNLIRHPTPDFPELYRPDAVERILWWTRCQPYLIQLLCALLVERMNAARREPPVSWVEVADVDAVVPLALERGQGYFSNLWAEQAGSDCARRVLEALAHAPDCFLERAKLRSLEPDERALRDAVAVLVRRELVEHVDDGCRIVVPLVAEYVRQQTVL